MRTDQRRYFGHPDLLAFIQRLSSREPESAGHGADRRHGDAGRRPLQQRHASHQSGLDVDIWLQLPRQRWSAQQLLKPQPIDPYQGRQTGGGQPMAAAN